MSKNRIVLPKITERTKQLFVDITTVANSNWGFRVTFHTIDALKEEELINAPTEKVFMEAEVMASFSPESYTATLVIMLDNLIKYLNNKDLGLDDNMKKNVELIKEKLEELLRL